MLRKPFSDLRMPVCGIVVDDRVDRLSFANVRVDLIEEADEFLMPMALHVAADNGGGPWTSSDVHYVQLNGSEQEVVAACEQHLDHLTKLVQDFIDNHPE